MLKKIMAITLTLLMLLSMTAMAKVGVDIYDPSALPEFYNFKGTIDSQTTTRYTPWFVVYHLSSPEAVEDNKRAGEGGQILVSGCISPVNDQKMFMGTDVGGLYVSRDAGENWFQANNGLPLFGINDMVADPDDEDTAYLFLSSITSTWPDAVKLQKTGYCGVYKTTDLGQNWTQVLEATQTGKQAGKYQPGMKFDDKGRLFVCAYDGIMMSEDKGATWTNLGLETKDSFRMDVQPKTSEIVVAVKGEGIYYTKDLGKNWELKTKGLEKKDAEGNVTVPVNLVGINPNNENHYIAVSDNTVFHSYDKGNTFTEGVTPRSAKTKSIANLAFGKATENGDPMLYLTFSGTVYPFKYSSDLGKTWGSVVPDDKYDIVRGNTGYWTEVIIPHPNQDKTVYYSFNDILYKSVDGGVNFKYSNSGFSGNRASVFKVDGDPNYDFVMTCTDKGLLRSIKENPTAPGYYVVEQTEDTVTPRYSGSKTITSYEVDPFDSTHSYICIGTWSKQILAESKDNGKSYKHVDGIMTSKVYFHDKRHGMIYTAGHTSNDGGKTWEPNIKTINAVSTVDNDILYSYDKTEKIVYRSDDCGKNWIALNGTTSNFVGIIPDYTDAYKIWVVKANGTVDIYNKDGFVKTLDETNGLAKFDNQYPTNLVHIAFNPENPKHMLMGGRCVATGGMNAGLYESLDGGENWRVVPGLPGSRDIWQIVFDVKYDRAFIATSSGTIVYEYENYKNFRANEEYKFVINGMVENKIHARPEIRDGEMYLGLRTIMEKLGAVIGWDSEKELASVEFKGKKVFFDVENKKAEINGEQKALADIFYSEERTMVSLSDIKDIFGIDITFDENTRIIEIK